MINKAHIKIGDVVYGSSNSVDIMYDENTNVYDKITDMSNTIDNINIGIETAKSDWNQNDETASNYIKNRPFYHIEEGENWVKEEIFVNTDDFNGFYESSDYPEIYTWKIDICPNFLTIGNQHKIIWDYVEYICTSYEYDEYITNKYNRGAIGNRWLIDSTAENTGEPFFICVEEYHEAWAYYPKLVIYTNETIESHNIQVYVNNTLKQLDEKFIPTNVAKVSVAEVGQILEVESVDENGKPLSYIASDKPDLSSSVMTVPQELTEEQKMQARKNQGLYYEQIEITYQGDNLVFSQENNLSVNIGFLDVEIGKTYSLYCDNSYVGNVSGVCEGDRRYDIYQIEFTDSNGSVKMTYDSGILTWNGYYFPWDSATVSITILEQSEIIQVEDKFIPDTIARTVVTDDLQSSVDRLEDSIITSWNDLKDKPFYEEEIPIETLVFKYLYVGWYEIELDELLYKQNTTHKVTMFDGSVYEVKAKEVSYYESLAGIGLVRGVRWIGNPTLIENPQMDLSGETDYTDLPFVVYSQVTNTGKWETSTVKLDSSVKASMGQSLEVYELGDTETIITPLDEKFIPDSIARTATTDELQYSLDMLESKMVTSWNELKDRPFYDEGREKVYITEETEVDFSNGAYFFTNDIYKLNKDSKDIIVSVNGVDYSATAHWNGYPVDGYFIDITNEDCPLGYDFRSGFYDTTGNLGTVIMFLFYYNEIPLKQLDEKFIPDSVARTDYVDTAIADLVGSAPETLNTIQELATAIEEHKDVTDVLDAAITNKANASDLNSHVQNTSNPHSVTKEQIGLNNVANVLQYSADNPPPYPVTSVNGKTGAVTLTSETWTFTLNDGSTVTKKVVVM